MTRSGRRGEDVLVKGKAGREGEKEDALVSVVESSNIVVPLQGGRNVSLGFPLAALRPGYSARRVVVECLW